MGGFKKHDGFTLVELMVVVLVIGILVAVAVPVFNAAKANAQAKTCAANVRTIESAEQQYRIETGALPTTLASLAPSYVKKTPACPTGGSYWISALSGNGTVWCTQHSAVKSWGTSDMSWLVNGSTWAASGGWIQAPSAYSKPYCGDATLTDYRVEVKVKSASHLGEGIFIRRTASPSGENYPNSYILQLVNGPWFELIKVSNGGFAGGQGGFSIAGYDPALEHTIVLEARGSSITCYIDGVSRKTWTGLTYTQGNAGYYSVPGASTLFGPPTITPL